MHTIYIKSQIIYINPPTCFRDKSPYEADIHTKVYKINT